MSDPIFLAPKEVNKSTPVPNAEFSPGSSLDLNANGVADYNEMSQAKFNELSMDKDLDKIPDGAESQNMGANRMPIPKPFPNPFEMPENKPY